MVLKIQVFYNVFIMFWCDGTHHVCAAALLSLSHSDSNIFQQWVIFQQWEVNKCCGKMIQKWFVSLGWMWSMSIVLLKQYRSMYNTLRSCYINQHWKLLLWFMKTFVNLHFVLHFPVTLNIDNTFYKMSW